MYVKRGMKPNDKNAGPHSLSVLAEKLNNDVAQFWASPIKMSPVVVPLMTDLEGMRTIAHGVRAQSDMDFAPMVRLR